MDGLKKKLPVVLGLSLLTGLVGSIVVKRTSKTEENYQTFVGDWAYYPFTNRPALGLTVTKTYQLIIGKRQEAATLVELTPDRLVLLDHLGYHLVFEKRENEIYFYDETADREFLLTPYAELPLADQQSS